MEDFMDSSISKRIVDMAEAHLLNVQREVQALIQRKTEIENEISKLEEYLKQGLQDVSDNSTEQPPFDSEES